MQCILLSPIPFNIFYILCDFDFLPEQESQRDNKHGEDFTRFQVFVQFRPKVVVDCRDDEVDLEELGGQTHHQEEGEEGDEEHLREESGEG